MFADLKSFPRRILPTLLTALLIFAFLPLPRVMSALAKSTEETGKMNAQRKAHIEQRVTALMGGQASHRLGAVAISPDGAAIAFVHGSRDGSELMIAPSSDLSRTSRISAVKKSDGKCSESMPAWLPDSRRLVFKSDCSSGSQNNLYLASIAGDFGGGKAKVEITRLTEAKGEVGDPVISPDGSKVGFLYVEGATRSAGALDAMKPWAGVIGEDGVEIQRVAMVRTDEKKPAAPAMISPEQLHVYEFDWAPDARSLVYVAANPPGENNWWVAKLYTQAIDSKPVPVFSPENTPGAMHGLQIAVPRWSPDGKSIAFIGGLMSDQGSTGGDVWLVPASGGEPVDLTPKTLKTPVWIEWGTHSRLYVSELAGGKSELASLEIAADGTAKVSDPYYSLEATPADDHFELSLSSTRDKSTFVFSASSFDRAPELYSVSTASGARAVTSLPELKQLTHFNDDAKSVGGKTDSLEWTNEGFHVQGWLHYPKDYDPGKKYPMLVLVHGGPAAAAQSGWGGRGFGAGVFSAMGYFVLEPNPRGSYGQGEEFAAANRKDFGYGDLRDILAGVDTAVAKASIDQQRIGLLGWSYGGFMTMFGVTQTNRFKAAVAGAGISDWKSYYGENSIDQWMTPYFGASVYKDPAVYARSSAIDFIDKVKTPTLVVVGDRDGECPAPQSFEFWHALRDENVATQLVVYPNEGHGFTSPEHRKDLLIRMLDWFAQYMPGDNSGAQNSGAQ